MSLARMAARFASCSTPTKVASIHVLLADLTSVSFAWAVTRTAIALRSLPIRRLLQQPPTNRVSEFLSEDVAGGVPLLTQLDQDDVAVGGLRDACSSVRRLPLVRSAGLK
eukprot:6465455-Amphidinium_carterae.1